MRHILVHVVSLSMIFIEMKDVSTFLHEFVFFHLKVSSSNTASVITIIWFYVHSPSLPWMHNKMELTSGNQCLSGVLLINRSDDETILKVKVGMGHNKHTLSVVVHNIDHMKSKVPVVFILEYFDLW